MANDNKKSGSDVHSLFSSLGMDPKRYQHSTQARKSEVSAKEAESRWPLLGEMRASFAASEEASSETPPPMPETSEPGDEGEDVTHRWNLLEALAAQSDAENAAPDATAEPTVTPEPPAEPDDDAEPEPESEPEWEQPASTAAPAPQERVPVLVDTGPSLEEVFGQHSNAPAVADRATQEKPEGDNLQALFTRLRGGADTRQKPAPTQQKGLSGIFDRLRRKKRD